MGTVQEVRVARRTGFCYGVREAIDYAKLAAAQGKTTHTLGQVVHNAGVISELEAQGIRTVESLDDVDRGAAVVIRAHGVTPEVMARAETRGLEVIDGTCTWVIQEQKELAKLVEDGYTIVRLGTPNHPEVVGLLGFAPDAIVVDDESDWDRIPRKKRMALITQSTQPPWKFERLAAFMVNRAHELKIINSVCPLHLDGGCPDDLAQPGQLPRVGGLSPAHDHDEVDRLRQLDRVLLPADRDRADAVDDLEFVGPVHHERGQALELPGRLGGLGDERHPLLARDPVPVRLVVDDESD